MSLMTRMQAFVFSVATTFACATPAQSTRSKGPREQYCERMAKHPKSGFVDSQRYQSCLKEPPPRPETKDEYCRRMATHPKSGFVDSQRYQSCLDAPPPKPRTLEQRCQAKAFDGKRTNPYLYSQCLKQRGR
jgi:hypothetical protein